MKKRRFVLAISLFFLCTAYAQTVIGDTSIIRELERPVGKAVVKVHQDPRLDVILKHGSTATERRIIAGYRIQVFSDNSQRRAKDEAQSRATIIEDYDSDLAAYVTFNSPFWRVRVGDFTSYEDATVKLRELKSAFPNYTDMRIVKDNIIEKY
ncbi:MAG: SPOR domain-containing protein [Bacteroidales bacterium]